MNVLSSALIAVFAILCVNHFVLLYFRVISRRAGFSAVPLVNGIIGCAGFALSDNPTVSAL